ncbi:MAG: hypothetical protein MHM6MM_003342, partial [Cercozoa sp. M6MM]
MSSSAQLAEQNAQKQNAAQKGSHVAAKQFSSIILQQIFKGNVPDSVSVQCEIPGRMLTPTDYEFDLGNSGVGANFAKPVNVRLNEARLADRIFDTSTDSIAGDTGRTVSDSYVAALNSFAPTLPSDERGRLVQAARAWLAQKAIKGAKATDMEDFKRALGEDDFEEKSDDVEYILGDDGKPLSRVENYAKYRMMYATELQSLRVKQLAKKQELSAVDYLEWWRQEGSAMRMQLDAVYDRWLIDGDKARCEYAITLADFDMPGQQLEETKSTLRFIQELSEDGARFFPVRLDPSDWGNSLRDFTDPESISQQIVMIQKQEDALNLKLVDLNQQLVYMSEDMEGVSAEAAKLSAASAAMQQASMEVSSKVNAAAAAGFDSLVGAVGEGLKFAANPAKTPASAGDLVKGIATAINGSEKAQDELSQAAMDLCNKQAEYLKSLSSEQDRKVMQQKIRDVTTEIARAKTQLSQLASSRQRKLTEYEQAKQAKEDRDEARAKAGDDAEPPQAANDMWTDINFTFSFSATSSTNSSSASASSSSSRVRGWFYSKTKSKSEQEAASHSASAEQTYEVAVSMRVMKVNITRGWLDMSLLQQATSFEWVAGPDAKKRVSYGT